MDGRRWDTDKRRRGVTDARRFLPDVHALASSMNAPDWIAEEPDAHLLPHLERAIEASDGMWRLLGMRNEEGLLELTLSWQPEPEDRPAARLRAASFVLIGTIAEAATLVRERSDGDESVFDVTTGMLEGDGQFAPHGHLVRLRVRVAATS